MFLCSGGILESGLFFLFFFMVIIIVLNLIFGVIIDTFADLRSEKQKKEEILKTTCFICGEWGPRPLLGGWDGVPWPTVGGAAAAFPRIPVLDSLLWARVCSGPLLCSPGKHLQHHDLVAQLLVGFKK